MPHLEHEALGISLDIPEIRQRDMEALIQAERDIRRGREANWQAAIDGAAEEVRDAVIAAQRGKFRPNSVEMATLVSHAAESIVRRIQRGPPDTLADQESNGVWVRAMARLGWLGETDEEDVGEMTPATVRWIAHELLIVLTEAVTIPNA